MEDDDTYWIDLVEESIDVSPKVESSLCTEKMHNDNTFQEQIIPSMRS